MKILAIETSCDETALALLEAEGDLDSPSFSILSTALNSQIDIHKEYGGVFPALAKREHAKNLVPLLEQLFSNCHSEFISESQEIPDQVRDDNRVDEDDNGKGENDNRKGRDNSVNWNKVEKILERETELFEKLKDFAETHAKPEINMIAVTSGPGLEPALWVGINFARALSLIWNIPIMEVNHMEGHIASVLLQQDFGNYKTQISNNKINSNSKNYKLKTKNYSVKFPALALLISGGHTEIVLVNNWGDYKKIGETKDDAVGEAYDKVARLLDLPYPGGPEISKLAKEAREKNLENNNIQFPRPMLNSKDLNFSLSGLKTAVLYKIKELKTIDHKLKTVIAKEFEQAVLDVIIKKVGQAIKENTVNTLIVGGGVIANEYIRENLENLAKQENIEILLPKKEYSTDNAVMIGVVGYLKSFREKAEICPEIKAFGNLDL
jgi:N6-L-threonylcarbamoyladenine synthase